MISLAKSKLTLFALILTCVAHNVSAQRNAFEGTPAQRTISLLKNGWKSEDWRDPSEPDRMRFYEVIKVETLNFGKSLVQTTITHEQGAMEDITGYSSMHLPVPKKKVTSRLEFTWDNVKSVEIVPARPQAPQYALGARSKVRFRFNRPVDVFIETWRHDQEPKSSWEKSPQTTFGDPGQSLEEILGSLARQELDSKPAPDDRVSSVEFIIGSRWLVSFDPEFPLGKSELKSALRHLSSREIQVIVVDM